MEDFRIIDKEESELKILSVLVEPRSFGAVEIQKQTKLSPRTINKRLKWLLKGYVEREGIKYKLTEKGRNYQTELLHKFESEKISDFNPRKVTGISLNNSEFGLTASADVHLNEVEKKKFSEGLKKIEEEYSKLMNDLNIGSSSCTLSVVKN